MIHDAANRASPEQLLKHIWIKAQTESLSTRLSYNEVKQTVHLHNSKPKELRKSRRPQLANFFDDVNVSQNVGEDSSSFESVPSYEDREQTDCDEPSPGITPRASVMDDDLPLPEPESDEIVTQALQRAGTPTDEETEKPDNPELDSGRFNLDGLEDALSNLEGEFASVQFRSAASAKATPYEHHDEVSPNSPLLGNSRRWQQRGFRDYICDRHSVIGAVYLSRNSTPNWNHLARFGYLAWMLSLSVWTCVLYVEYFRWTFSSKCDDDCSQVVLCTGAVLVLLPLWSWLGRLLLSNFAGACHPSRFADLTIKLVITLISLSGLCIGIVSVVLDRDKLALGFVGVTLAGGLVFELLWTVFVWKCCRYSCCELPRRDAYNELPGKHDSV